MSFPDLSAGEFYVILWFAKQLKHKLSCLIASLSFGSTTLVHLRTCIVGLQLPLQNAHTGSFLCCPSYGWWLWGVLCVKVWNELVVSMVLSWFKDFPMYCWLISNIWISLSIPAITSSMLHFALQCSLVMCFLVSIGNMLKSTGSHMSQRTTLMMPGPSCAFLLNHTVVCIYYAKQNT